MTSAQASDVLPCAIVVPCYNEAERLAADTFRAFIAGAPQIHLILVNDGSRDATINVLNQIREGFEARVEVLDLAVNGGKGEAVRQGLLYASSRSFPVAGFWDADLATPLPAIWDLLGILQSEPNVDVVMGSRVKLLGRDIRRTVKRHIIGRVFATAVSNVLNLAVYDTQCGAKLFRNNETFRSVIAQPFLSRWIFDVEMLGRMIRLHGGNSAAVSQRIYEFPLHAWADIGGSKLRLKDFIRATLDIGLIYRQVHGR